MKKTNRRMVLWGSFAFLLTCLSVWYIASRGGVVNALHLPPVLDSSTPETQNGFILLDVQQPEDRIGNFHYTVSSDAEDLYGSGMNHAVAGLWIQVPVGSGNGPISFHASAHSSTGETFLVQSTMSRPLVGAPILFVSLPADYPGTMKYVDVTLSDDDGQSATWRIDRLPSMQHVIVPPVETQGTCVTPGMKLSFQAERHITSKGEYIRCRLYPVATPGSHQWELSTTNDIVETEWMPYLFDTTETSMLPLTGEDASRMMAFNHGAMLDDVIDHPYVGQNHYVRVQGHLKQYETYDETVTFHSVQIGEQDTAFIFTVKQHQSVTTPSGITVTLPTQSKATFMHQGVLEDPVLLVTVEPHETANRLPNSPLAQQYDKPVGIDILPSKPLGRVGWSVGPGPLRKLQIFVPHSQLTTAAHPRNLTLIVRQRVDLQSFPLALTIPITNAPGTHA